jgi:hypothetical protein
MGSLLTILKVHENLPRYADPGQYNYPEGTALASDLRTIAMRADARIININYSIAKRRFKLGDRAQSHGSTGTR